MAAMVEIISKMMTKLGSILSTGWGWATGISLFVADYFAGHKFIVWLVITVTLMDAIWGIAVSLRLGNFAKSELARLTVQKFAVYGCAMLVFVGIDKVGGTTLTASVVGVVIVLVEFYSSLGNMLILYPHMPFLRLMRKALTGEIASKLRVKEEEVEEALENLNNKKKKK